MPTKLFPHAAAAVLAAVCCASPSAQVQLYSLTIDAGPYPYPSCNPANPAPFAASYARPAGDVDDDGYDDLLFWGAALWTGYPCFPAQPPTIVSAWVVSGFDQSRIMILGVGRDREMCGVGDVDGDGHDDVIYAPTQAYGLLELWTQTGVLTLVGSSADEFGESVDAAGDVDGDGFDDVLVSSRLTNGASPGTTTVFSGRSLGTALRTFPGRRGRRVGDVDGDGARDFVTIVAPSVVVHSGRTGATLRTLPFTTPMWAGDAGDVDADGFADLVVEEPTTASIVSGATGAVLHTAARGLFPPLPFLFPTMRLCHAAGDVDGDGFDDVWVTNDLVSGATGATTTYPGPPIRTVIGDFDRDGRDDWVGFGPYWEPPQFSTPFPADVRVETAAVVVGAARAWTQGPACLGAGTSLPYADLVAPPRYGSTLRFTLGGARPSATSVFHLGLPGDFALGLFGAPGCALLVAPFFVSGQPTSAAGAAQFSFALAPSVLPPDVEFSAQWIGLDPGGNALGIEMSDALRFIVGN